MVLLVICNSPLHLKAYPQLTKNAIEHMFLLSIIYTCRLSYSQIKHEKTPFCCDFWHCTPALGDTFSMSGIACSVSTSRYSLVESISVVCSTLYWLPFPLSSFASKSPALPSTRPGSASSNI